MGFLRYYRTIKYLKPSQIAARLRFKRIRPKPDLRLPPFIRKITGHWTAAVPRPESMLSPTRFRFLNIEGDVQIPGDWNSPEFDRLWLYNLHYFDFLNSVPAPDGAEGVMNRWITDNFPGSGAGWESYPLSLRIVNWIKRPLKGVPLSDLQVHSLAVQVRFLSRRLEYHLLANHLFANAKALVFAGLFFEGREATAWLAKGLDILHKELDEQVLEDGGHFERSPLYHTIILEDLLDLINVDLAYPNVIEPELVARWKDSAYKMLCWLSVMTHPDGRIALFNDADLGTAAAPSEIAAYAVRLGIKKTPPVRAPLVRLAESGYFRASSGPLTLFVDAGPLGPDYQPGHGHADTLSFELSHNNTRIIVDSGVSTYAPGEQRLRERSTGAHNTLEINGCSSSEIWASFRVARRAKVTERSAEQKPDGTISIAAAHDGYRRPATFTTADGIGLHKREFVLSDNALEIKDIVTGRKIVEVRLYFYFHPGLVLEKRKKNIVEVLGKHGKTIAFCQFDESLAVQIEPCEYHPLFGLSLPSFRITCGTQTVLPYSSLTVISFEEPK